MTARTPRRLVALLTSLALLGASLATYAEPTPAQKETARTLMKDGRDRRDKGDHKGALEKFKAAHAIMKVPTTGLEVGREEEALGQLNEARDTYLAVARMTPEANDPKPFAEARAQAEKLADAVAPRIPSVKVVVTGVPEGTSYKVSIDDAEIPSAVLAEPYKVDPGPHKVVVEAGKAKRDADVELAESEAKDVAIAFEASDFGVALKDLGDDKIPVDEPKDQAPPPSANHTLTYVGFGVAGAGLIVGTITGLMSMSKTSSIKSSCVDNKCPTSSHADLSSAKSTATISTISFAVAGVGAVIGVIGLLTSKAPKTEEPSPTAGVHVWIGVGSAGLVGAF